MRRVRSKSVALCREKSIPKVPRITLDDHDIRLEDESHENFSFLDAVSESRHMLQQRLGGIIQEGITEGQRLALSSGLWQCASTSPRCDVLITIAPHADENTTKEFVFWLHDVIKKCEPQFELKIRRHCLTNTYGIYITANYTSLLKGAELCHLKKRVKPCFGGGMRDFSFDEAQCFQGLEIKSNFLSSMERSMIVRQMLLMIKAPSVKNLTFRPIKSYNKNDHKTVRIPEGATLLVNLMSQGLIDTVMPTHDTEILAKLNTEWVWTLLEEQPLARIESYFGTEIAMYFAWLEHYTTALFAPALIGLIIYFLGGVSLADDKNNHETTLFGDICFVCFAFVNCIWSTAYLEFWKRHQAELAFKWGTYDVESDDFLEEPRPAYKGECLKPNPVSGRLEPFYPEWKHFVIRYGITFPITFACVLVMFMAMFCLLQLQDIADAYLQNSYYFRWILYVPMVIYALIIVCGDFLYRRLAIFLNDLENYRTDEQYETYLIQKVVIFQCVSAFGSMFYIAFYLGNMKRLQETLATLLLTRQITQNLIEIGLPLLMGKFKIAKLTYQMTRSMSDHSLQRHVDAARNRRNTLSSSASASLDKDDDDSDSLASNEQPGTPDGSLRKRKNLFLPASPVKTNQLSPSKDTFEVTQAELESLMPSYARPLDDYLEMFIQFGYVLLFSPAFPLAAACAAINNLFEIRIDAMKLCNTVQRPFGRRVKNIGAWQKAMELMGIAGVIVNCALIGKSGLVQRMWPNLSAEGHILLIIVLEHLVMAAKSWLDAVIPDIPQWIRIESAKTELWRREAYKRESRLLSNVDSNSDLSSIVPPDSPSSESSAPLNKKVDYRRNIERYGYRRANHSCAPPASRSLNFY
uniref:Anoctamin n=1 Tax=Panagrellus redivivus TaxID=6233 RepID=A0A7E4VCN2_PANRE